MDDLKEQNVSCSPPRKKAKTSDDSPFEAANSSSTFAASSSLTKSLEFKISAHGGECGSVLFLKNSTNLVSGGKYGAVKIWDTSKGTVVSVLQDAPRPVCGLAVSPDNKLLVAALSSSKMCVWELSSGLIRQTLGHWNNEMVTAMDVSRLSSQYMVSGTKGAGKSVVYWDLQQGTRMCSGHYSESECNAICFSMDDQMVCSGHSNGSIFFTDNGSLMRCLRVVKAHTQSVTSLYPLQNRNLILSSGRDNWHNLIDVRTGQVCTKFRDKKNKMSSNCVSPDDEFVAVGGGDGLVKIWSLKMCKMVESLKGHSSDSIGCCSWSGLGKPLASGDSDGNVCVWT